MLVAAIGFASTVGGILITGWLGRRQNRAQVQEITNRAHGEIYAAYEGLLRQQRTDAQITREEARSCKDAARAAEQRADAAEEMAYQANDRMRSMERLLSELRPFLERVPGSEAFVAQIDRALAAARP
jgi:hypothetical protein